VGAGELSVGVESSETLSEGVVDGVTDGVGENGDGENDVGDGVL